MGKTIESLDTYDVSLEDILHKSEISKETYLNALKISQTENTLVLKRNPNEMHINSYNPDILHIWQANMDIKFILDAYACVMYVTSFMMKSERAMGDLLKQVSKECESESIQHQLRRLGSTFLNHRGFCSGRCLSAIVNASSMSKPLFHIAEMDDDDDDDLFLRQV